jgi:hypothetical protein
MGEAPTVALLGESTDVAARWGAPGAGKLAKNLTQPRRAWARGLTRGVTER